MNQLPWLRLYTDTVDNEKLRLLAFEDRWHFVAILCIKQQGILDQNNQLLERQIAVKLGIQLRELDEVKRRLMEVNLIDNNFQPVGWADHQFMSDSSTERTRKYRKNKKNKLRNVTSPSQERNSDVIDTDTDTDTEKEKEKINTKKKTANGEINSPDLFNFKNDSKPHIKTDSKSILPKISRTFKPPTLEQVQTYCEDRCNHVDPEQFLDFYESKDWMIGKNKMKNWQAAVRTWERNVIKSEPDEIVGI